MFECCELTADWSVCPFKPRPLDNVLLSSVAVHTDRNSSDKEKEEEIMRRK